MFGLLYELSAYWRAPLRANMWTQQEFVHTRQAGKYMHGDEKWKEAAGKREKRRDFHSGDNVSLLCPDESKNMVHVDTVMKDLTRSLVLGWILGQVL